MSRGTFLEDLGRFFKTYALSARIVKSSFHSVE